MAGDPRRPQSPRRRSYPLAAYLPFTIMVAVPIILLILLVWLISSLTSSHGRSAPALPTPSATTPVLAPLPTFTATAAHPGVSPATARPARTPTSTPALTATVSVTVAVGATPAGAPIGAATVFHGSHARLWAFASIADVHAGDTIRFIWRDLSRNTVVENYPEPVQVNAARFQARMYAYLGNTPAQPFPQGQYRVDVYHNKAPTGSRAFRIVP